RFIRSFGGFTEVTTFNQYLGGPDIVSSAIDAVGKLDLVILTADKPRWKLALWLQEVCYRRRLTLIRANHLVAGPLVVPGAAGGCIHCELLSLCERLRWNVDEVLSEKLVPEYVSGAISTFPSLTGALVAHEIVRYITGIGTVCLTSNRISISG